MFTITEIAMENTGAVPLAHPLPRTPKAAYPGLQRCRAPSVPDSLKWTAAPPVTYLDDWYGSLLIAAALRLHGKHQGRSRWHRQLVAEVNSLARYRGVTPWITHSRHWALRDKTLNAGLRAGFPDE